MGFVALLLTKTKKLEQKKKTTHTHIQSSSNGSDYDDNGSGLKKRAWIFRWNIVFVLLSVLKRPQPSARFGAQNRGRPNEILNGLND